ncbi:hypothetical protein PR003_g26526 [Phytophthora rubi]|uniref:Uncharacterized protein n=1 Tax=Phytophthora rubi TaxID=129364 RepID=A0A6A3MK88_9STRA|nr:hypothetical protein PR002_g8816 [Phytophthora rubi]KAE9037443.1 hypothetical protein PR001_g8370 [Phytophthora rubi]KAE9285638.1 hypothetical protein PR003_g26526 [Phytophthora rubi]
MKLAAFFTTVALAVSAIQAQDVTQQQDQQQQQQQQQQPEWHPKTIGHDDVKPFPQPEPVTISEKAAVKFKPQIDIVTGCVPYPAVNDIGETSGGLQTSGSPRGRCRGSGYGSQIYGRSTWFNGVWAIMYSWYFPKDAPSSRMGHRHDWEHLVVFIDNPDVPEPKIGYNKYAPCPAAGYYFESWHDPGPHYVEPDDGLRTQGLERHEVWQSEHPDE